MSKAIGSALALLFLIATPVLGQQPEAIRPPRVLSVSGTATVQKQPDRAVLVLAVESRAGSAQEAARSNANKMDAIYAALRRAGIVAPQVATVSYALQPEYRAPDPRIEPVNSPAKIVGYTAMNTVRVQVDSLARVGNIIDATIAAGANRIENLSFELRDPQAARLDALRKAVERARAEADVLASAAGQKLGAPQSINTVGGYVPQPMYRMNADLGVAAAQAPTPVEPGMLNITVNVNITYLLEDR
jgi:uncharacterized protein YggE